MNIGSAIVQIHHNIYSTFILHKREKVREYLVNSFYRINYNHSDLRLATITVASRLVEITTMSHH